MTIWQNTNSLFLLYWETLSQKRIIWDLGMKMPSHHDFSDSEDLDDSMVSSIASYRYFYQPQAGMLRVREALAHYETQKTGLQHRPQNIMMTSGALRGFSLAVDTLFPQGTTFIEIAPTYPLLSGYLRIISHRENHHVMKIYPSDETDFIINLDELLPFVAENKVFVLTNPNNPTGLYFGFLKELLDICIDKKAYVIIDEANDIPHGGNVSSLLHESIRLHDRIIRIRSFSKNNFIAGFRLGYIVSGEKTISILSNRYAFSDGNAPTVLNDAIITQYKNPVKWERELSRVAKQKVEFAVSRLSVCSDVEHIILPDAGYYLFVRFRKQLTSWDLFLSLLEQGVNVVPGTLFGIDNNTPWIRICCAREYGYLEESLGVVVSTISAL